MSLFAIYIDTKPVKFDALIKLVFALCLELSVVQCISLQQPDVRLAFVAKRLDSAN